VIQLSETIGVFAPAAEIMVPVCLILAAIHAAVNNERLRRCDCHFVDCRRRCKKAFQEKLAVLRKSDEEQCGINWLRLADKIRVMFRT